MSEGLPGPESIKTPFGTVKKNQLYIGGFIVVIAAVLYYRSKATATTADASGQAEINPATGYPFGSPEDAAALEAQYQFRFPNVGGGGGNSGSSGQQFTSNAQWSQYAIEYMVSHDIVVDSGPITSALGKYLAGQPVNSTETSLIQQAIAIADKPPIAGTNGYPPSINTSPSSQPPPDQPPPANTQPGYAEVKRNWKVNQWITDYRSDSRSLNRNLTWPILEALNPGISGNIVWHTNSELNTFKNDAKYRVI